MKWMPNIVRAETGTIQNKLKNVSSKLLNEPDIDSNIFQNIFYLDNVLI